MSTAGPPVVDLARCRSAFIVKPSSLGDIVHTLPAVHAMKTAFPHLQLRWLANTEWTPLLEGNADLAEVIPFPRGSFRGVAAAPAIFQWVRKLNAGPREFPEITVDFQGLARSALLSVARGSDPIIGMSDSREGARHLYRQVVEVDRESHSVERYLQVVAAMGCPTEGRGIVFPLPDGVKPEEERLESSFIVLHPYSRGRGKSLTEEAIDVMCRCLAPRQVVIVGRREIPEKVTGMNVLSFTNRTSLSELIWLLRQARAVVSVDSGPMHIAAAVNDRTLGIHTWSNPARVGPYNPQAFVWKAGRTARRQDFTREELRSEAPFAASDARRAADFVLQNWC